jgi:hypothetical protein
MAILCFLGIIDAGMLLKWKVFTSLETISLRAKN